MANPVLVVGSVALDTVETPFGKKEDILGGAATHFSMSARHFAPIRLVGVVGKDFPPAFKARFEKAGIDLRGLNVEEGDTFRWHGRYKGTMDSAETMDVKLNVFGNFRPDIPKDFRASKYVHLGTAHPKTQKHVLEQLKDPEFVMVDTIELWIDNEKEALIELFPLVHALCINYEEAIKIGGEPNLPRSIEKIFGMGLRTLVVKRAEHGATLALPEGLFSVCSYPTKEVVDPTGAGDAFAGGVMGYVARHGADRKSLRQALVYGSVMGSFAVEGFGTEGLDRVTDSAIRKRVDELTGMMRL